MPIVYKTDILSALKEAGYNTNRIRKEKLLSEGVLQSLRGQKYISMENLARVCSLLDCQPGDLMEFLPDEAERTKHYHKGIFVDIFPGDRVPSGKLEKTVQYIACAINLLYSRGHTSGSGGLIGKAESILLKAPKKKYTIRRERAEKSIRRWNGKLFCTAGQLFFDFPVAVAPVDAEENRRQG